MNMAPPCTCTGLYRAAHSSEVRSNPGRLNLCFKITEFLLLSVLFSRISILSADCPAGYHGKDNGPCEACPAGSYKSVKGSSGCLLCSQGKYSAATAQTQCNVCGVHDFYSSDLLKVEQCASRAMITDLSANRLVRNLTVVVIGPLELQVQVNFVACQLDLTCNCNHALTACECISVPLFLLSSLSKRV